jgi:23S rRNA pseudouridine1911/1915/1917 synthase
MPRDFSFRISSSDQGTRLDKLLSEKNIARSRAQIKRLFEQGAVYVDGKPAKGSRKGKEGQLVLVTIPDEKGVIRIIPEDIPLDILFEDSDIIVVNKQAGLVVHPAPGHRSGTLVNALIARIRDLKPIQGELRPGIVHRLDKETSGVIVIAKNESSLNNLANQFKERLVTKIYRSIVVGSAKEDEIVTAKAIGRSDRDRKKMSAVTVAGKGRVARTSFKIIERFDDLLYVEARPETGRTHQIRVHLANLGLPVVGDKLYLKDKKVLEISEREVRSRILEFPRQALHALSLTISHPATGQKMRFDATVPEDMAGLLDFLRSKK